ncbi:DUF5060 domain-containing protein [Novipirellula artificiosorum]|uniref:DUF5060 domain-containing protein n=1 Tax=Novipirellula artificiosorum TaxID=2528016 RepID=UPI0018CCE254|nr:DUF5060 domain-containing protein [Novipirellula artificiosorum]
MSGIRYLIVAFFLLVLSLTNSGNAAQLSGEQKTWHKMTLTFDGPDVSEAGEDNPFLDYRLSVTFSKGNKQFVVPGYFAADGDAANSSASAGNKWRVHFRPDEIGDWNYSVSFRTGQGVALKLDSDNADSEPWSPLDGTQGSFVVEVSDKVEPDLRAAERGRVVYDGSHVLKYAGSSKPYVKIGEGSPENFLAYHEFDQTRDLKNNGFNAGLVDGLHRYAPHQKHFKPGDPTWQDGKGKGIIGAVNYLASQGLNSIYFLTFNIGADDTIASANPKGCHARICGDGGDTWPWISPTERLRIDVSKLDQWDRVFTHANDKGIGLTFMLAEAENEEALDGDATTAMGPARSLYYREMVARFSHQLNVMWIIAEETATYAPPGIVDRNKVRMKRIHALDPYKSPVGLHNGKVKLEDYAGYEPMTYYSYQGHQADCHDIYPDIVKLRSGSEKSPPTWVVINDEQGKGFSGVGTNTDNWDPGFEVTRRDALWGTLMAGGTGVSWYHGGDYAEGDGNCEDFTQRSELFRYSQLAANFIRDNDIPLAKMLSRQDLLVDPVGRRCLAAEGAAYIVQLNHGGDSAILRLGSEPSSSQFRVRWFDPVGGWTQTGTVASVEGGQDVSIGVPKYGPQQDWIALVQLIEHHNSAPSVILQTDSSKESFTVGETLRLSAEASDQDGTIRKVVFMLDGEAVRVDKTAPFEHSWAPTESGSYQIGVRVYDDQNAFAEAVPRTIQVTEGTSDGLNVPVYLERGGMVIMEAEDTVSNLDQWITKTELPEHTGEGYLEFTGNTPHSGPPKSPLHYRFKINQSGLYTLHLRCAKEEVDGRADLANDCYVRVEGDFGQGPLVGDNHNDQARLALLRKDTKFFGGEVNQFVWSSGNRLDPGGKKNKRVAIYDFKSGETYRLIVSGRSQLFKLDHILFKHTDTPIERAQNTKEMISTIEGE